VSSDLLDPHVVIAILCLLGAGCIAGGLVIWFAIEAEMRRKK
jgi:hypothetical protein